MEIIDERKVINDKKTERKKRDDKLKVLYEKDHKTFFDRLKIKELEKLNRLYDWEKGMF